MCWIMWSSYTLPCKYYLANYNISLTLIKAIWGWFPLLTMIPVRSQWGRYNLPRNMKNVFSYLQLSLHFQWHYTYPPNPHRQAVIQLNFIPSHNFCGPKAPYFATISSPSTGWFGKVPCLELNLHFSCDPLVIPWQIIMLIQFWCANLHIDLIHQKIPCTNIVNLRIRSFSL